MTYLFWACAAVWGGIFVYLRLLARKSEALANDVEMLRGRTPGPPPSSVSAGRPPENRR